MIKQLLISLLVFSFLFAVLAQNSGNESNIKLNVLSQLVRTFSGFYERKISESSTLQLGLSHTVSNFDDLKIFGFGITPKYRFYASLKGAIHGFYYPVSAS